MNNNKKGFTLIELLAVITIMGILMLVAIPAVSRTIENSRKESFVNTAKSYINSLKNIITTDELKCGTEPISAVGEGYYFYKFTTLSHYGGDARALVEQGGKSSWGSENICGTILIHKTYSNNNLEYEYSVILIDNKGRGIGKFNSSGYPTEFTSESYVSKDTVKTTNGNYRNIGCSTAKYAIHPPKAADNPKIRSGSTDNNNDLKSIGDTDPIMCTIITENSLHHNELSYDG